MGNRAVITTAPFDENDVGIYLHWNGGRASIEGFLAAAHELGWRSPGTDRGYAMARLTQLIANFFGADGLSIGVGLCRGLDCDNGDNGVYLLGQDWEIVGRLHANPAYDEIDAAKTLEITNECVLRMHAIAGLEEERREDARAARIAAADARRAAADAV